MIEESYYLLKILAIHIFVTVLKVLVIDPISGLNSYDSNVTQDFIANPILFSIAVIVVAPIMEEVIFRLPLKNNNHLWVSIVFVSIFFLGVDLLSVKIIMAVYLIGLIILWYKMSDATAPFVLFSALAFGVVHISNYDMSDVENAG